MLFKTCLKTKAKLPTIISILTFSNKLYIKSQFSFKSNLKKKIVNKNSAYCI